MRINDIDKARTAAERMNKASAMLALIDQGPLRIFVGQHANQAEIVLTQAGKDMIETLARRTLAAEVRAASQTLRDLGVDLGDPEPDPQAPAPAVSPAARAV